MKKSIVYLGVALVAFTNVASASNFNSLTATESRQINYFEAGILDENNISVGTQTSNFYGVNRDSVEIDIIESANKSKIEKSTDELFAEDNAITENNISNETQALDFEIINRHSINDEIVEWVTASKNEKTPEELIAEDNAITENNLSNETQALDFRKINRKSNMASGKSKSIFGFKLKS